MLYMPRILVRVCNRWVPNDFFTCVEKSLEGILLEEVSGCQIFSTLISQGRSKGLIEEFLSHKE